MTKTRAGNSPLFFILAMITIALSSWGYYGLLTDFAQCPPGLALIAIGGLDIAAVLFGRHALTVAADGDSPAPWNAALLVLTGVAMAAQYQHAALADWPPIIGVIMSVITAVTVLLFEGQLRRKYRLAGRAAGRISPPRATFDLMTWVLFAPLAFRAMRLTVLDRGLDPDTALLIAEKRREADKVSAPPGRRKARRTYRELSNGDAEWVEDIVSGQNPDTKTDSDGQTADTPPPVRELSGAPDILPLLPDPGVATAARLALALHGGDVPAAIAAVTVLMPAAKADTIGRTVRRLARSTANGTGE